MHHIFGTMLQYAVPFIHMNICGENYHKRSPILRSSFTRDTPRGNMGGTQDGIFWQDELDSVSDDDSEDIDIDAGDEYYRGALSHEQVLQLLEKPDDKSDFESF